MLFGMSFIVFALVGVLTALLMERRRYTGSLMYVLDPRMAQAMPRHLLSALLTMKVKKHKSGHAMRINNLMEELNKPSWERNSERKYAADRQAERVIFWVILFMGFIVVTPFIYFSGWLWWHPVVAGIKCLFILMGVFEIVQCWLHSQKCQEWQDTDTVRLSKMLDAPITVDAMSLLMAKIEVKHEHRKGLFDAIDALTSATKQPEPTQYIALKALFDMAHDEESASQEGYKEMAKMVLGK